VREKQVQRGKREERRGGFKSSNQSLKIEDIF
jgi:hypothetical protein